MGYTHYWYRDKQLNAEQFAAAAKDFQKVADALAEHGLVLAAGWGTDDAEITSSLICFNGQENCGHTERDLGITWPSDDAGGVNVAAQPDGEWFAGVTLPTRTCGGDCSHEGFLIEPQYELLGDYDKPHPEEGGKYFAFCKTAYKPYDLAVTACLIILKHHISNAIKVYSDGKVEHWFDAQMLCSSVLGYGIDFALDASS